jgi:DNA-binding XRE family transcriptional regulator
MLAFDHRRRDNPMWVPCYEVKRGANVPKDAAFNQSMAERVKLARERAGLTQGEVAQILKISQTGYSHYEVRPGEEAPTLMPHQYIEDFCVLTRVSVEWLITGKGSMARSSDHPSKRSRTPAA